MPKPTKKRPKKPNPASWNPDNLTATTMIRMTEAEREAWDKARKREEKALGIPISMSAFIRRATNAFAMPSLTAKVSS